MAAHPFGIIGLIMNMVGSLMLLWFPPSVTAYSSDGAPIIDWSGPASEAGKRKYRLRKDGFKLAIALLFLGFFLQLLDLIKT
jgi:hypothetical protein